MFKEGMKKEGPIFHLWVGQKHEEWMLYVRDPSIAVECLRRRFLSTRDIVTFFVGRGSPFILAFESNRPCTPALTRLLPLRPSDFTASTELYNSWEKDARAFMLTSKSRPVWKFGGLLWRLALFLVGSEDLALVSLDEPPSLVTCDVTQTAYEETLNDCDIELMIGMYHIASSKCLTLFS